MKKLFIVLGVVWMLVDGKGEWIKPSPLSPYFKNKQACIDTGNALKRGGSCHAIEGIDGISYGDVVTSGAI